MNEQIQKDNTKTFTLLINRLFIVISLIVIIAGILMAIKILIKFPEKTADAVKQISDIFSTKEKFSTAFGPIVEQERFRRLQFFQRNQVCLFRIIRYIGKDDKKKHSYVEFYKKESEKKPLSELPIFLNQYCELEAKGTYEFNFYVDMGDLSKWDYQWEEKKFTLTLYPPDISANTPAELEPLVFRKVADSIGIDESFTKSQLEKMISSNLKQALAEDQKKFFYEEAKLAIKDIYMQFFKLIPNVKIEKYPEIKVIFPHEKNTPTNQSSQLQKTL